MLNGYYLDSELKGFFELPIDNDTTLSIYDTEEGYEIEFIENIDKINEEVIDVMLYDTEKWETLSDLLEYTINNTYVKYYSDRIIKILEGNN